MLHVSTGPACGTCMHGQHPFKKDPSLFSRIEKKPWTIPTEALKGVVKRLVKTHLFSTHTHTHTSRIKPGPVAVSVHDLDSPSRPGFQPQCQLPTAIYILLFPVNFAKPALSLYIQKKENSLSHHSFSAYQQFTGV